LILIRYVLIAYTVYHRKTQGVSRYEIRSFQKSDIVGIKRKTENNDRESMQRVIMKAKIMVKALQPGVKA